jgi:hypothetical protein
LNPGRAVSSSASGIGAGYVLIHWLGIALSVAVGIPMGLFLGLLVMRRVRTSTTFRIGAVLTAALFSFVTYQDSGERAAVEESESETKRKKEKESGDPPHTSA